MSVTDEAWRETLRLWTKTSEAPSIIGRRFGITQQRVVGRARSHNWPDRPEQKKLQANNATTQIEVTERSQSAAPKAAQPKAQKSPLPSPRKKGRAHVKIVGEVDVADGKLLHRVHEAIEKIVRQIEDRMKQTQDDSIADTERLVRTLGVLIQNIGKIQDVDDQFKRRRSSAKSQQRAAGDAERRRQALAARVCSILGDGSDQAGSGSNGA